MKNGKCPKCENQDIKIFEPVGVTGRQNNIQLLHFAVGFMKSARIKHYVCKGCGFIEMYIKDEDIDKL